MTGLLTHFAVGAVLTTLVATYTAPALEYRQTVTVLGGAWGALPSLVAVGPSALADVWLFDGPAADVFWGYDAIAGLELSLTASHLLSAACLLALLVSLYVAERRERRADPAERPWRASPDRRGDR